MYIAYRRAIVSGDEWLITDEGDAPTTPDQIVEIGAYYQGSPVATIRARFALVLDGSIDFNA